MRKHGLKTLMGAVLLGAAACAPAQAPEPAAAPSEAPMPPPTARGWFEADGPGETALVYRAPDGTDVLILSCAQATRSLTAAMPTAYAEPLPEGVTGTLFLGTAELVGPAERVDVEPIDVLQISLPLTAEMLTALAGATTARLVVADVFGEAEFTDPTVLGPFAERCGVLAGLR